jgi:hypothetical protein
MFNSTERLHSLAACNISFIGRQTDLDGCLHDLDQDDGRQLRSRSPFGDVGCDQARLLFILREEHFASPLGLAPVIDPRA